MILARGTATRPRRTATCATALVGLIVLIVARAAVSAGPVRAAAPPTLSLSTSALVPGHEVTIVGTGWAAGTNLQFEVCGAAAVDGATDCAAASAVVASPGPDGSIQAQMAVLAPPRPCPCVVLVTSAYTTFTQRIPVTVTGVAVTPVRPIPAAGPVAVTAWVTSDPSVASWFGAPAPRRLNLILVNEGSQTIEHPVVTARYRRGSGASDTIDTPALPPIGPRQSRRIVLAFDLDVLAHGDVVVTGIVEGAGPPAPFATRTSTQPFGLLVVAIVLVQLVLLAVRNRARARMSRGDRSASPPTRLVPPESVN